MTESVTPTLLYLDNITVSFDGFRALNALSLAIDEAEPVVGRELGEQLLIAPPGNRVPQQDVAVEDLSPLVLIHPCDER